MDREAIDFIRNNLGEANFFSFGIGSSVNRFLIEGMAQAGKGEPFVLTSQQEAKKGAKKFRTYIESPVLTDIKIELDGFEAYDVEPMNVPDVFAERPVIVFGKYKGSPYGKLKITGTGGQGKYVKEMPLEPAFASADNEALKYLWARKRIQLLDDFAQFGRTEEAKKEVTALGLKYNLLTQYTSFIAIDSEIRNKGGKQSTVVQPLPLPEGVSDRAVGYAVGANSMYKSMNVAAAEDVSMAMEAKREEAELSAIEASARKQSEQQAQILARQKADSSIIFSKPEKLAEFVGGSTAMDQFIRKHLGLTDEEIAKWKQLSITVELVVKQDGSITDVQIHGCNDRQLKQRILKVFEKMPRWKPAEISGLKVNSKVTIPIKIG